MHIQLLEGCGKEKVIKMIKPLNAQPNRFINQFFDAVDKESFVDSMQQLMRDEHVHLKVIVAKNDIKQNK